MTLTTAERTVRVGRLEEIEAEGSRVVEIDGQTIALFQHEGRVYAIDNRCPHMGFPLHQGSLKCGILTCHWHHARFDLASGGTFDPWADDVRSYPVQIDNGDIWVDMAQPAQSAEERHRARLADGLRHNLRLVVAKSVIGLHSAGAPEAAALEVGADFGTRYANEGWGSALTILTAMGNILPHLHSDDRPRALYQGLTHVSNQVAGQSPAFALDPLPTTETRPEVFKAWFRDFIEVRNRDGAERALRTAIAVGVPMPEVADTIFAAATDHLYHGGGHTLDFANKAFELLDRIGWQHAGQILSSLIPQLTRGGRSEEMSSWRHPIDLAKLLWTAFEELPRYAKNGGQERSDWSGRATLVETLLTDHPEASVRALLAALEAGATHTELASAVAYAAARRIAQFRTSNEYGDWITVLHTFTYANAVHQAVRRSPSIELLRGVFDAAISVYLDRFLNMPPAPLPRGEAETGTPDTLFTLLDSQQQVDEAARLTAGWLASGGSDEELMAALGHVLLREDAEFHSFQVVEAGFRQYEALRGTEEGRIILVAVARYLAAHSPTARAMGQTYQIALRLNRGEALYTE
jgi:nitrite reductase/ring-hydroxylating ferredoxin subunit